MKPKSQAQRLPQARKEREVGTPKKDNLRRKSTNPLQTERSERRKSQLKNIRRLSQEEKATPRLRTEPKLPH